MERECLRNIELRWLLDKLTPDHNTISDFRMENRLALKKVFKAFVRDCVLLGLVDGQSVCIDGTPKRAVNSKNQAINIELSQAMTSGGRLPCLGWQSESRFTKGEFCKNAGIDVGQLRL